MRGDSVFHSIVHSIVHSIRVALGSPRVKPELVQRGRPSARTGEPEPRAVIACHGTDRIFAVVEAPEGRLGKQTLRTALSARRATFGRYEAWFVASSPGRAASARILAEGGLGDFRLEGTSVRALVPSSAGGFYPVELVWGGRRTPPTPRGYQPRCPCPDRRPWCKHAMALAYMMADLR